MPTIFDTLNVQMCTISYGKEASFAGKLANVTITVTPMAAGIGPIRLNWAVTGDIFSPFSDTTSGDTGAPGIIALPRTDQDGFRHGTNPFKNWYYKAAVVATLADGQQLGRSYQFQTASSTLDLDLLDEDSVVTALPVVIGAGTEPAGLSDATQTALAATFVALRGAWATGTAYPKNSLVIQGGAVYLAAADVPSRTTFTAADWQALGGSGAVTPTVATTVNADGTFTATGSGVTDNGDGTFTITDSTVTANADGTFTLAA